MGPFIKVYDFSSFDIDIYQLESFDKNLIQVTYKLSDQKAIINPHEIFKWTEAKGDKVEFYCTFFFNFEKINNSEQIKLGHDFKIKVELAGKKFHFWLNSESVRHRDLKAIYEDEKFTIPDGKIDSELMVAVMPKNIDLESERKHLMSNLKKRENVSMRSVLEKKKDIDWRIKDIKTIHSDMMYDIIQMEEEIIEELQISSI